MALRALILDLDGTLAASIPAMREIFREFLAQFGCESDPNEFDRLNGPSLPEIARTLKDRHELALSVEELIASYALLIRERYPKLVRPAAGARELLSRARALGLRIGLATAAVGSTARTFLNTHDLAAFFDAVVTGDDVDTAKPDPAIYRCALAALDVAADEALAVEDSPAGLRSCTGAGIRALALDPEARVDLAAFPLVLARVSDLVSVIPIIEGAGVGAVFGHSG